MRYEMMSGKRNWEFGNWYLVLRSRQVSAHY